MSYKNINPDISEIKTGTPAIKIGDKYVVGGIGGNFIPQVEIKEKEVTLGQVDADGNFQPLAFNGTEASNSGNPETVENYYGWNGTLPVPDNGIKVGEATEYYKCASVDTTSKTWSGYLAILGDDGVYTFEETATTGLTYGMSYKPSQGSVYNNGATLRAFLWQGSLVTIDFNDGTINDAKGHTTEAEGGSIVSGIDGNAWNFAGGYITVSPATADEFCFGTTGDFTFEMDIYPTSSDRQCILAYQNDGIFAVAFSYSGNNSISVYYSGSWSNHAISDALEHNKWYHVVIQRKGGVLQCFVDNIQTTYTFDASSSNIGSSGQFIGFGRWGGDAGDFSSRWQGYMDNIKIYNKAIY